MFIFDVLKRTVRLAPAAILLLTLTGASQAQSNLQQCETQCRTDCEDAEFGKAAIAACVAGCPLRCAPKVVEGTVHPKYLILAIIYAPPGCTPSTADKCTQSKVDYANSSSIGTKVSTSSSFKSGVDVSVTFGGGGSGNQGNNGGGGDSASFGGGFSVTTTDSTSETITKSQGTDISTTSIQDGVDHDLDTFFLLVNPVVNVTQQGTSDVFWNLGFSGSFGVLQTLTVSELKNPSTMPSNVAQTFAQLGFTNSDYQTILSQDPFASGGFVDPNRFVPTTYSFPYEPPSTAAGTCVGGQCNCSALAQPISNQLANEVSQSVQTQYSVSLSSGFSIPTLASFKTTDSFTWTDQAATANTVSNSQTANAQIQCPSPSYTGPTGMEAYWDALYGTFAFVPFNPATVAVIHRGTLTDSAGKPVRGEALSLTVGGLTYHTVSGANGTYEFAAPWEKSKGPFTGTGVLSGKGVNLTVPLGAAVARIRIQ